MIYVSKIVFNDGTSVNVSDIYNLKKRTFVHDNNFTADDLFKRVKSKLPLSKNRITQMCRNISSDKRNSLLRELVDSGILTVEKDGKKTTFYNVSA